MQRRGFTLVELMIVVIILGILAAIVVPQFSEAGTDAAQSNIAANVHVIRRQLQLYKMQHNGVYPKLATFTEQMTQKTNVDGTTTGAPTLGPYLQRVPDNPAVGANTLGIGVVGSSAWRYDENSGAFNANDSIEHKKL